eukprot:scaffold10284_cov118-Isochrysis_galbana.AAC.5
MTSASAPSASSWPCGASRPRAAPPPPSRRQLNNCAQFEMQPASNGQAQLPNGTARDDGLAADILIGGLVRGDEIDVVHEQKREQRRAERAQGEQRAAERAAPSRNEPGANARRSGLTARRHRIPAGHREARRRRLHPACPRKAGARPRCRGGGQLSYVQDRSGCDEHGECEGARYKEKEEGVVGLTDRVAQPWAVVIPLAHAPVGLPTMHRARRPMYAAGGAVSQLKAHAPDGHLHRHAELHSSPDVGIAVRCDGSRVGEGGQRYEGGGAQIDT